MKVISRRAGKRLVTYTTKFITAKLKFRVIRQKSEIERAWHRKILGFGHAVDRGPDSCIAPNAILPVKERIENPNEIWVAGESPSFVPR